MSPGSRLRQAAKRVNSLPAEADNSANSATAAPASTSIDDSRIGILLSGVSKNIVYELKKRGFVPKYSLQKEGENTLSIAMVLSPKLFMKLVIELNFPVKTQRMSSTYHISRVYAASLKVIERMKVPYKEALVFHDDDLLQELKLSPAMKLDVINDYFGSSIALYFGWLQFYTNFLVFPAIGGTLLFCQQLYTGKVRHKHRNVALCGDV